MAFRHRRRRVRLSAQPIRNLIPNMITIVALCAGMSGIRYGLDDRFELAVALVMAAAVLDGLDGNSARILGSTSRIGAQLDSLADFLSFGVAPATLVYLWTLHDVRGVGWAIAMLFATCCALRLARFNSELELPDRPRWTYFFFTGIPAPAAAGLALAPMMLSFVVGDGWPRSWLLNAAILLFVAVMMVSRVPTFSLKRVKVQPDMVLPTLLLAFVIIAGLVVETWLTLSVLAALYLGSIPFSIMAARRLKRREPVPAAAAPVESAPSVEADRIVSFEARPGQRSG
jgi:CDP-diacylglycerol---serine O-phosphatidyltransferase